MKVIVFITVLILTNAYAQTIKPERGLYECKKGNEESICDQVVRPFYQGNSLTAISVEYVGWCGSMGPYTYYCENSICEDPGLKFVFKDSKRYTWENKQYGFKCDFEKK